MDEKEAIENVEKQLEGIKKANECGLATRGEFNKDIEAIETVLNLLENKDKQIEQYKNMLATNDMLHVLECEKKDKMIDLMAEEFEDLKLAYFKKEDGGEFMGKYRTYNKNDWEQYFERKVENGN